jgi:hypothetical protein
MSDKKGKKGKNNKKSKKTVKSKKDNHVIKSKSSHQQNNDNNNEEVEYRAKRNHNQFPLTAPTNLTTDLATYCEMYSF